MFVIRYTELSTVFFSVYVSRTYTHSVGLLPMPVLYIRESVSVYGYFSDNIFPHFCLISHLNPNARLLCTKAENKKGSHPLFFFFLWFFFSLIRDLSVSEFLIFFFVYSCIFIYFFLLLFILEILIKSQMLKLVARLRQHIAPNVLLLRHNLP